MKKFILGTVFLFLLTLSLQAQRNCGTMDHLQMQLDANPQLEQQMQQIEQFTQQYVQNYTGSNRSVITIPVVVHIVHNGSSPNITAQQVQSQMTVLTNDFRKLNNDATNFRTNVFGNINADTEIEFCLASVDPNGSSTTGIIFKSTGVSSFGTNDAIKFTSSGGSDAWPTNQYLNLWVGPLSSNLLGYAQFPGGAASTDGVVVSERAFGSGYNSNYNGFNGGRTTVHEVGHWLNLRHIWGDGPCMFDDGVNDTPTAGNYNYGCPSPNTNSCKGRGGNDLPDMWENYMDYTDDVCMYAFTAGQKARMQAVFSADPRRMALISSPGCGGGSTPTCAVPSGLSSSSVGQTSANISWSTVSGANSYDVQYRVVGGNWSSPINTSVTSTSLQNLSSCEDYEWQVRAKCSSSSSSYSAAASFSTTGCTTPTCAAPTGLYHEAINHKKTRLNWSAVAGAVGYQIHYSDDGIWTSTTSGNNQTMINTTNGHNYEWYVVTDCGGTLSAESVHHTFIGGSAKLMESLSEIAVYPNPANEYLIVDISSLGDYGVNIYLTDILGRTVQSISTSFAAEGNVVLETEHLTNGIYFIKIDDGEEIIKVEKVMISK